MKATLKVEQPSGLLIHSSAGRRLAPLSRGMTLLEVILALAVFSLAAVALVNVMNQIGFAVLESRTLRNVEQGLESVLDEYSKAPLLGEMERTIKPGKDGVTYEVVVRPVDRIKNQEGRILQGIFHIEATAKWKENGQDQQLKADTLRYAGLFQPVN